jgi:hypothetical protein
MKKLIALLVVVGGVWFLYHRFAAPGGPDLIINDDEVLLATDDLDVRFSRGKSFEDTYMIFGGGQLDHGNAIANVTVAGLSVRDAKPIYSRYPDFDRCASPGAALAKKKVVQLDMVPVDGDVLALLRQSLEEFDDNIANGGDRVCIQVHGSRLKLTSAEVRQVSEDVTDTIRMDDFYLVDSVDRRECRQALGDV